MGLEERMDALKRRHPILGDQEFLVAFPDVVPVAALLDSCAAVAKRRASRYPLFDDVGVASIGEYLARLQEGDVKAVRVYERIAYLVSGETRQQKPTA